MQDLNYDQAESSCQVKLCMHVAPQRHVCIPLWVGVFFIVIIAGSWSAWNAYVSYNNAIQQEYRLLELLTNQREARISGALRSVDLMLGNIINDLQQEPRMSITDKKLLLKNSLKQLPEIRSLLITDAEGRIQIHTKEDAIGIDASSREYFTTHRDAPESDNFHVSAPFKTFTSGIIATTQSRVIRDRHGNFVGVMAATLESTFFNDVLKLSDIESKFQVLLINLNGVILNSLPSSKLIGKNLRGGIAYTEHIKSGQSTTRHLNVTKLESTKRMSVFHVIPNSSLAVILSRNYSEVIADWSSTIYSHMAGFILLLLTVLAVSWLAVRRQNSLLQVQGQLSERESYLRAIIESEPECVKQLAEDGTLMQMNRAGLNMIEADSLDQVLGLSIQQLVTPEYRDAFITLTRKVFNGGSGTLVFEILSLKGTHRWLETHATPLRNAESQIIALLGITRDITERKQSEEERFKIGVRYQMLQSVSRDGIHILDQQGDLVESNTAFRSMLGYNETEDPKLNVTEWDAQVPKEQLVPKILELIQKPAIFETMHRRSDGTCFPVEVNTCGVQLDGIWYLYASSRDITERKQIEASLEEERRTLKKALDEVRTLRGIVPICSSCKKIRDDKGFWSQVEKYVSDHTEAKFSHGVCPDCAKELYPELFDELGRRKNRKSIS